MKMESQVCTLEQSKKLKILLNLGQWKNIDYSFYWMKTEANDWFLTPTNRVGGYAYPVDQVPCFTVAELGVMLNMEVQECFFHNPSQMWSQKKSMNPDMFSTQAECYANWLIYILENNRTTTEEVNKRLAA